MEERIDCIYEKIDAAAQKSGRKPADVRLIAISRKVEPAIIREAMNCGITLFGESRVEEAKVKIPMLSGRLHWHFIGHLQSNKIRQALPFFECFHGVDSLALATNMNRIASEIGTRPMIFLETNVSGEGTKFGFKPDILRSEMEILLTLQRLDIAGLMTMAPLASDPETARPFFTKLRELRDDLEKEFGVRLPELSMGMSNDFEVAIEEGATYIRIGTGLFGKNRTTKNISE